MKKFIFLSIISTCLLSGCTAEFNREVKDAQSNLAGGLNRTVTIYDMNGKLIKTYTGKFDVEIDNNKIKFDDDNGKRHIILNNTGTVCIDEN